MTTFHSPASPVCRLRKQAGLSFSSFVEENAPFLLHHQEHTGTKGPHTYKNDSIEFAPPGQIGRDAHVYHHYGETTETGGGDRAVQRPAAIRRAGPDTEGGRP